MEAAQPSKFDWMTPPEAAQEIRISPEKVLRWIASGELPAVDVSLRTGKGKPRWRISRDAWRDFLKRRASQAGSGVQDAPKMLRPIRRRKLDYVEHV